MAKHERNYEWSMEAQTIDHKPPPYDSERKGFVVNKDAFPTAMKKWYLDYKTEEFQKTLVFRVAFLQDIDLDNVLEVDSDRVREDCDIIRKTDKNAKLWSTFICNKIFDGDGNNSLYQYANQAMDQTIQDQGFTFEGVRPWSRDDVSKLMFFPQGKAMTAAGGGDYGPMVAYFMCLVYYLTGPKSSTDRFYRGIEMWADKNGYKLVLGDQTTSGRRM